MQWAVNILGTRKGEEISDVSKPASAVNYPNLS